MCISCDHKDAGDGVRAAYFGIIMANMKRRKVVGFEDMPAVFGPECAVSIIVTNPAAKGKSILIEQ